MSNRANTRILKTTTTLASILFGAALLAGCSSLGLPTTRLSADELVTGSIGQAGQGDLGQSMPGVLQSPSVSNVASGRYLPPANVGSGISAPVNAVPLTTSSITTVQLLPPIPNSSTIVPAQALPASLQSSPVGSPQIMSAQPQIATVSAPRVTQLFQDNPIPQVAPSRNAPALAVVSNTTPSAPVAATANTFKHTIESGESLYAIARRYDVSSSAIVSANSLSAPDQIFVGQKLIIPGRADLMAARAPSTPDPVTTASVTPQTQSAPAAATPTPTVSAPTPVTAVPAPVAVASSSPAISNADDFRWPVTGRVIANFQDSRRTGINIEAPSGASVRAAENGTVIYVGNGVSGFGNLVLVRHSNGYVSAYAHLKDITTAKGSTVSRGDQIGTVGMSGSVNRPQLHFELRQGATPVDPMPLLAS